MADKKISALTGATTPLAGTEVLPIVQSGATVKVAVSDLTAGRAMAALSMTLTSTDAGATAAPLIDLYRDSASPAVNDTLGEIEFNGEDSAGNKQQYALIHGSIISPTSGAEGGQIHFETTTAGASTEKMVIGTSNLVINDIGAVYNVRIEGDTDANLFYTDATNSRIGVGTITPASKVDVVGGDVRIDNGNLIIGTSGKGIDFSITSHPAGMTSELLADYEEGTWTPAYTTSNGAYASVTHSIQLGQYRKVGSLVYITLSLRTSAADVTGATGQMLISGLPYTAATQSQGIASMSVSYATIFASIRPMGAYVPSGGTTMYLTYIATPIGSNWGELAATELSTGNPANILVLSGCYIAA